MAALNEELEAREDAEDSANAQAVLARIDAGEETTSWEVVRAEIDAKLHDSSS